jgi:hypothetical protein
MTVFFVIKVYLKLCQSYTRLVLNNTNVNFNQEHRECEAIAMFSYKHSNFENSLCVHAFVHTRISFSLDLVAFVHSLLNNFSPNYCASFNHEYNTTTKFVDKDLDTYEQVITLHTHVYKVEHL